MKKLLLFPYHPDIKTLLSHKHSLKNYSICGVCSFMEDASIVNRVNQSLGAPESFDELFGTCDAVLILDNYRGYRDEKYYEMVQLAIDRKKELLIAPTACNALNMERFAGGYRLLEHDPPIDAERFMRPSCLGRKKYVIETPIIAVAGFGKNCGKFEVQLLLRDLLEKSGCQCSWISSNPLGALWGGRTLPNFMHSDRVSFEEKILKFNKFIYRLSLAERPDAFILGIPEGISEFRVDEFHHFGEYPLIVGNAVSVDSAILCTYFMNIQNVAGIEEMRSRCLYKFNFPVQALSIGNAVFEEPEGSNKIEYAFLEKDYLEKHYAEPVKTPIPSFPVWDRGKGADALNEALSILKNNADAI